jgi:hypothetical protein
VGTYVGYDSGESSYVGRILEVTSSQQIVVNCFVNRTQLADPSLIVAGRVTNESCKYMTELFQTSERVSIGSSDVIDLAFVFKETAIEAGGMMLDTCQGVSNAYVIRYKDDGELIPANECLAFPSDYQAFDVTHDFCYSRHIWSYLVRVNAEISKILGSASESQSVSNRKRVKMGMDRMCWRYLVEKAGEVGCQGLQSVSLLSWKRETLPGLTIKKRMEWRQSKLIRFESESDIVGLARLIGERALVNVRANTSFGSGALNDGRELKYNDTINVVVGGESQETIFRYRSYENGVDLIFDMVDTLVISVRYTGYQFQGEDSHISEMSKRIIERKRPRCLMLEVSAEGDEVDEEEDDELLDVYLESEFMHEGSLYRVSRITANQIFARCIQCADRHDTMRINNNYGEETCFDDLAYVKNLIESRLG